MEDIYIFCETEEPVLMRQFMKQSNGGVKGMALLMVLMIVIVSAGLLAAVMYFAMSGSEISGIQRKYQSSKEASLGAADIMTKEIIPRVLFVGPTTGLSDVTASFQTILGMAPAVAGANNTCFYAKLTTVTASWPSGCDAGLNPASNPDITFNLLSTNGASRPYTVDVKIIDTSPGNSDLSGIFLDSGGVVSEGGGAIATRHFPYLYTIESEGKLQGSATEKVNLEFLYAY